MEHLDELVEVLGHANRNIDKEELRAMLYELLLLAEEEASYIYSRHPAMAIRDSKPGVQRTPGLRIFKSLCQGSPVDGRNGIGKRLVECLLRLLRAQPFR